ncbi:MAG: lamin tail domain-containing protein, partial [Candidatus Poseidonia sp.]|nr:lamin tail domain-containing protein [Poseidonia sp.]
MKTTTAALTLIGLFLISLGAPMAHQSLRQPSAFETSGRSTACIGDICINEVIPNPAGLDDGTYPNGEWFELTNGGTSDVDLSSWSVQTSAN